jgi:tellurite resistance protein
MTKAKAPTKKKTLARVSAKLSDKEPEHVKKGKSALAKSLHGKKAKAPSAMTDEEQEALIRTLNVLETGFLAVAADGVIEQVEFDNMGINFAAWLGQDVPSDALVELVDQFIKGLSDQGFEGRLEYLASALDTDSRWAAFRFAAALSACDGEVNQDELGVLTDIAEAFGIPEKEANAEFNAIYRDVMEIVD